MICQTRKPKLDLVTKTGAVQICEPIDLFGALPKIICTNQGNPKFGLKPKQEKKNEK